MSEEGREESKESISKVAANANDKAIGFFTLPSSFFLSVCHIDIWLKTDSRDILSP